MNEPHRLDNPPEYHSNIPRETDKEKELAGARGLLQNLFVGASLEVRSHGFALIRSDLLAGLYDATEVKADLPTLCADALAYGLTAEFASRRFYIVFRKFHPSSDEACQNLIRAGGDVLCETCGFELREHPTDSRFPFLKVRCDGQRLKL